MFIFWVAIQYCNIIAFGDIGQLYSFHLLTVGVFLYVKLKNIKFLELCAMYVQYFARMIPPSSRTFVSNYVVINTSKKQLYGQNQFDGYN